MLWGISSFAALILHSAVRALPQGALGDLLPVGPELDEPVPVTIQTSHPSHTEQASTLSRVENATSALLQPTTHDAQLTTTVVTEVPSHPRLTPTQTPASRPPAPVPEGNETPTSIIATSAGQNTANPTWYPSPSPSVDPDLAQGHAVDWRVIGIAVIAVSVVGTMILIIMFFDQWWGFLCDVCGRRRKWQGGGKEELVPDWERGSWGFKVEDDNLPAYPSFGSPPAMQMQEGAGTRTQPWKVDTAHGPDQKMSPDHLGFPPLWAPKDNGQELGTQSVLCGPSRQHVVQFLPSGLVNEVTAYELHSHLNRSNTEKSTASEDAYDGFAA